MLCCQKAAQPEENAMKLFLAKFTTSIVAVLSCFDRLLFKGYLPISYPASMEHWLAQRGVLLKDFKRFAMTQSDKLKLAALTLAQKQRRPYRYLRSPIRKDDEARRIAQNDGLTEGLVCVFAILEQCQSFKLAYGDGKPRLESAQPRCLCLYFYYLDRDFGLIHIRLQTWLPYTIQIYVNGHSYLQRQLTRRRLTHQAIDNAFTALADPLRAQKLADRLLLLDWPRLLTVFAHRVNPLLRDVLSGLTYYWVIDQAEYATDVIFRDCATLARLYPRMLEHATVCFGAEDVMTFLGRKLHGRFAGEVGNHMKRRWPGARVKHRLKRNWLKMYDKCGCVLRIETVINEPHEFRVRRRGIRAGQVVVGWFPMAKRVGNISRYAQISRAANRRYLQALAAVDDPGEATRRVERACTPVRHQQRRYRALNPLNPSEYTLLRAVVRGEHHVRGFRSGEVMAALGWKRANDACERRRCSARLNRRLHLLRGHGLVARIPHTRRWRLTVEGVSLISAVIYLRERDLPAALNKPA
jgi:hypothetical protein